MFFGPLLVSFSLYYFTDWRPAGQSNHGELITPARALAGAPEQLKGEWSLVYIGDAACESEACRSALVFGRQTRLSLNQEMKRVRRVLLATANCCANDYLTKEHEGLAVADASDAAGIALVAQFPRAGARTFALCRRSIGQPRHALRCSRGAQGSADGPQEAPEALAHRLTVRPDRIAVLRRLALAALLLAFCVVVFGAYVRLTAAGLGCPDWPGCYGHVTPAGAAAADAGTVAAPLHVGKAWREMIHRYLASTLGLLIVGITVLSVLWRKQRGLPLLLPLGLLALVIFQGLLGMWTVTLLLKPLIVTAHLAFGLATLSLLWWLWLSLRRISTGPWSGTTAAAGGGSTAALMRPAGSRLRALALFGLVVLIFQILLGGWTSTNYAAVACPDFPTCQAQWWPQTDFKDAFVLWRGLGINYEGGVLDHPARVAIHLAHRLGAIVASLTLLIAAIAALVVRSDRNGRWGAWSLLFALALQLTIGIAMVKLGFPLWLATAHNAGAALLLLMTLGFNRALRRA